MSNRTGDRTGKCIILRFSSKINQALPRSPIPVDNRRIDTAAMVSNMTLQSVIKSKHAIGFIIPAGPNWRAFEEAGLPIVAQQRRPANFQIRKRVTAASQAPPHLPSGPAVLTGTQR